MTQHSRPDVAPERSRNDEAFDRADGYSGQDAHTSDEERLRSEQPSGTVAARPEDVGAGNGAKASFDPATGATRGSGRGPTEDLDTDDATIGSGKDGGATG